MQNEAVAHHCHAVGFLSRLVSVASKCEEAQYVFASLTVLLFFNFPNNWVQNSGGSSR